MTECDDDMIAYVRYRLEKSREVYEAAYVIIRCGTMLGN